MKRLREEDAAAGTVEREAIDLLRAARPLEVSPLARARVRERRSREPAARLPWLLRPVVVVACLVVGATVAGASLGVRLFARRHPAEAPAPVVARAPAPAAPSAPIVIAEPPAAAPVAAPEPRARPARHIAKAAAPVAAPPAPADDPTLVAAALRALRREHDAARAGALVEEYLGKWPAGALTEEAMALAVEAAAARHDARAADWAQRYLRRFPNGRFRDVVSRSLPAAP
jgi:TolA-binding protein